MKCCENRMKSGKTDEIMSQKWWHQPLWHAPVLVFQTLGCQLQHLDSVLKLSASSQNSVSTLGLVHSLCEPGHGLLIRSSLFLLTLKVYDQIKSQFSCHLGIIALTTGINCTRYHLCNYFASCLVNYFQSHSSPCDYLYKYWYKPDPEGKHQKQPQRPKQTTFA